MDLQERRQGPTTTQSLPATTLPKKQREKKNRGSIQKKEEKQVNRLFVSVTMAQSTRSVMSRWSSPAAFHSPFFANRIRSLGSVGKRLYHESSGRSSRFCHQLLLAISHLKDPEQERKIESIAKGELVPARIGCWYTKQSQRLHTVTRMLGMGKGNLDSFAICFRKIF